MRVLVIVVVTMLLICSCSTLQNKQKILLDSSKISLKLPPMLEDSFFADTINVISIKDVYNLNDTQKNEFFSSFSSTKNRSISPHKRVYQYLKSHLHNFDYYSDTFSASEALLLNKGNCLTLAILTKALADLAGVKVAYQLVETEPVYQKNGNIIVSSQHIRTVLFEPVPPNASSIYLSQNAIVIDYFPTVNSRILRQVSDDEFTSMFYSNKALEFLFQEELNHSFWYLKKALEIKPDDANAINIMAVLHEKAGYSNLAEGIYLFGLKYAKKHNKNEQRQYIDLLNNYHTLLKRQDRVAEAKEIAELIDNRNDPNPFKWISLGNNAYNARNYSRAIAYYQKAADMAPYLHESYSGIARSQYQMGKIKSASRSMEKAIKNSHKNDIQYLYQKKLELLNQLLKKKTPIRRNNKSNLGSEN